MTRSIELPAPLLLRGVEVAAALAVSRTMAYRLMQDGTLPTVRFANSIRVPKAALSDFIMRHTQTSSK